MSAVVRLPKIGVNDESAKVVYWAKAAGDFVQAGEVVCEVETTKAVVEIEAEAAGYLKPLAELDSLVSVGGTLAVVTDALDEDISALLTPTPVETSLTPTSERRWTKKAEILARRLGLSIEDIAARHPGAVVGEAEVQGIDLTPRPPSLRGKGVTQVGALDDLPIIPSANSGNEENSVREGGLRAFVAAVSTARQIERILILGSAKGGAAALILDAMAHCPHQHPVGILDRDTEAQGQSILGVPVLGSTERVEELWQAGACDAVIIAFNRNLEERAKLFEELMQRGVRFTNVIDPTTNTRLNAQIGVGNVILANSHIGPYAVIGDNNFLSSHTCIEHHCRLGSHCGFGPRVTFSGRVTVGDRVRFGTQIAVEPDVTIGNNAIIASGLVVTRDVPEGAVVKARMSVT